MRIVKAYQLHLAENRAGSVVFASPHSGCDYPQSFLESSILNEHDIRSSEDAFVDRLFADAPALGAPLLVARSPRAFIDLNRGREELDPGLISGIRRRMQNPRIASGLGVIPRVVSNGRAIYRRKITLAESEARIRAHWVPYHAALERLLKETRTACGEAILIDCHSMPSEAIESIRTTSGTTPDVVLGDRYGSAARPDIVEQIEAAFASAGFQVARNTPFAGAFIAQHYGRPSRNQHVVQVEINRALYMNEAEIRPNKSFESFRGMLNQVIARIIEIGVRKNRLAAE